ncbi:TRAP transporter large permease [Deltaproteobacteria bacterium OttesenSCG-928-K17]|nr:TRAP transporter large permease [Deltaproteobacteria bacterium OttesenSCG-928-K17]
MGFILFIVLLVVLFCGVPIAVSMGIAVLSALTFGDARTPHLLIVQRMFTSLDNFPFMAVPFFILAGDLMQCGGISARLIDFIKLLLRKLPARLSVITTVSSGFFGAISGSNPATVAAIGGIMIPEMKKSGYPPAKAAAIAATSGTLGVIIPPSISMVTYSLIASVSIGTMFIGGIVPGMLLGLVMVAVSMITCIKFEKKEAEAVGKGELGRAFVSAISAIMMPVIILGGIYGQFCTPTEAAAVACVYAFIISCLVYRELKFKELPAIFAKSARSTAIVLLVVAFSAPFSWLMTSAGIPGKITATMLSVFENKYAILLMMNAALLFLGCFLETQSIILLMTPILLPLALQFGIDPVALGLIIVVNTSIGMITPPMAVNLYVASSISGATIEQISKQVLPYFLALAVMVLLFTYVPEILMWLPKLVGGL